MQIIFSFLIFFTLFQDDFKKFQSMQFYVSSKASSCKISASCSLYIDRLRQIFDFSRKNLNFRKTPSLVEAWSFPEILKACFCKMSINFSIILQLIVAPKYIYMSKSIGNWMV
jgi:hypothetical protein